MSGLQVNHSNYWFLITKLIQHKDQKVILMQSSVAALEQHHE